MIRNCSLSSRVKARLKLRLARRDLPHAQDPLPDLAPDLRLDLDPNLLLDLDLDPPLNPKFLQTISQIHPSLALNPLQDLPPGKINNPKSLTSVLLRTQRRNNPTIVHCTRRQSFHLTHRLRAVGIPQPPKEKTLMRALLPRGLSGLQTRKPTTEATRLSFRQKTNASVPKLPVSATLKDVSPKWYNLSMLQARVRLKKWQILQSKKFKTLCKTKTK